MESPTKAILILLSLSAGAPRAKPSVELSVEPSDETAPTAAKAKTKAAAMAPKNLAPKNLAPKNLAHKNLAHKNLAHKNRTRGPAPRSISRNELRTPLPLTFATGARCSAKIRRPARAYSTTVPTAPSRSSP
jgi:hypothetical protein